MKKLSSQIWIGLLCILLGFSISYQIKVYDKMNNSSKASGNSELDDEIESLKEIRDDLKDKSKELNKKVDEFEKGGIEANPELQILYDEAENGRILLGETAVSGEGVEIKLSPKPWKMGSEEQIPLRPEALVGIVNELYFAGAEAISINDIRLTGFTGIRKSTSANDIFIGTEKISANKEVIIRAIGNTQTLYKVISYPDIFKDVLSSSFDLPIYEKKDKVNIPKTNQIVDIQYLEKVEDDT